MRRVKLYTSDGGFVVAGYVPPFLEGKEADVLLWGDRVFRLTRVGDHVCGKAIVDHDQALVYAETFAVALVTSFDQG